MPRIINFHISVRTILLCLGYLLIMVSSVPASQDSGPDGHPPRVINGVIDLRHINLKEDRLINLSGNWKFFWNQYLAPETGATDTISEDGFLKVPGAWNGFQTEQQKLSGHGYATYQATVLLGDHPQRMALKILDMSTAFSLFINGTPLVSAGSPGLTPATSIPRYFPGVFEFDCPFDELNIIVHISNFHHWQGGIWEPILLGNADAVNALREKKLIINAVLFGSILIMGIYHIGLYGFRSGDIYPLYFGAFCIMITIRILTTGERYLVRIIPSIPYEILVKLVYVSFYLSIPFFAMYIQSLFPDEIKKSIATASKGLGVAFSVLTVIAPPRIFTWSMPPFQIITLLLLAYGVYGVALAVIRKKEGAVVFAIGFSVFSITAVNDILLTRQLINSDHLIPVGLFFFIFSQAFLISKRFSKAFVTVEKQHTALSAANQKYQETLKKQTQAQNALEESEKQYRLLIENCIDGICIVQYRQVRYSNSKFKEQVGIPTESIPQQIILKKISPEYRERTRRMFEQILTGDKRHDHLLIQTYPKEGKFRYFELNASLIDWKNRPAVMTFVRDVSDQKNTQELLIQTEKMLSVGGLAAGMAHEINNPLAGMMQNAQVISNRLSNDNPANVNAALEAGTTIDVIRDYVLKRDIEKHLVSINAAGNQAAGIVRDMLSFARKNDSVKQSHNIIDIIEKTITLAQNDYNLKQEYDFKDIRIIRKYAPSIPDIFCEKGKIQQVIFNIVKNAAEALFMKPMKQSSPAIIIHVDSRNGFVVIRIQDNGPGMPPDIKKRIFEPFFTTKNVNKGTGLGLSVSYFIIVETHGGHLDVESEPGMGTSFKIMLPISAPPQTGNPT